MGEGKPILHYDGDEFHKVIQTTRIRKSLNLQKRKNAKGFSAPLVEESVAADLDLDLDQDAPDLPMPGQPMRQQTRDWPLSPYL
jgi:hypothetical protein